MFKLLLISDEGRDDKGKVTHAVFPLLYESVPRTGESISLPSLVDNAFMYNAEVVGVRHHPDTGCIIIDVREDLEILEGEGWQVVSDLWAEEADAIISSLDWKILQFQKSCVQN